MSWTKGNYASLLMVMISCFLGVAFVEITLRIFNANDPWSKTAEANILRDFQYTYHLGQLYDSDTPSVEYIRDQYGLRDACESPSEIDILTIGGSTTDQRFVTFSSTYQAIMEERLKNFNDSFGCVSNAGLDGHSTWGHLFSFKHWFPLIPGLNPKVILLYIGVNDADFFRSTSPRPGFDTRQRDGLKSFIKSFELVKGLLPIWRLLRQSSDNASAAYAGHVPRQYTHDDFTVNVMNEQTIFLAEQNALAFRSRMQSILDEIYAIDATPLCVTQPHRYVMEKKGVMYGVANILGDGFSGIDYDYSIRELNDVMFNLCGKNTVDLYNHEFSNSHFYDGTHTTAAGSTEIGKIIAEFIISESN